MYHIIADLAFYRKYKEAYSKYSLNKNISTNACKRNVEVGKNEFKDMMAEWRVSLHKERQKNRAEGKAEVGILHKILSEEIYNL